MKYIKTETILLPFKSVTHVTFSSRLNMTTGKEVQIASFWFCIKDKFDCIKLEGKDADLTTERYLIYLENENV